MRCEQFVVDNMKEGRRQCRRQALQHEVVCKRHRNKRRRAVLGVGEHILLQTGKRIIDRRIRRRW